MQRSRCTRAAGSAAAGPRASVPISSPLARTPVSTPTTPGVRRSAFFRTSCLECGSPCRASSHQHDVTPHEIKAEPVPRHGRRRNRSILSLVRRGAARQPEGTSRCCGHEETEREMARSRNASAPTRTDMDTAREMSRSAPGVVGGRCEPVWVFRKLRSCLGTFCVQSGDGEALPQARNDALREKRTRAS